MNNAWFPAFRIRCRSRFRKNRVRTGRLCRCCWGVCATIARQRRQAHEVGRRVSRAKQWAELQARRNGRYGKIELDPKWWNMGLLAQNDVWSTILIIIMIYDLPGGRRGPTASLSTSYCSTTSVTLPHMSSTLHNPAHPGLPGPLSVNLVL